ncbi:MAG: hypothetical protein Q9227_000996 [Pyrenula ochraceoflavens]
MSQISRNLCSSCALFEERCRTEWRFGHTLAPNLLFLEKSASNGCSLCQLVYQSCIYEGYTGQISWIIKPIILYLWAYNLNDDSENSDSDNGDDDHPSWRLWVLFGDDIAFSLWVMNAPSKPPAWCDPDYCGSISNLRLTHSSEANYSNEGVEAIITLAKTWALNCRLHHTKCTGSGNISGQCEGNILPTRLIDVGSEGDEISPKLVITDQNSVLGAEYVALSYAWGSETSYTKTMASNLQVMTESLGWSGLPRTIQDAIIFTRKFGVKYLWVDALCILQSEGYDDALQQADWHREADRFGQYYQNAIMTISATGAKGSDEGLFLDRPGLRLDPQPLSLRRRTPSGNVRETILYPHVPLWKSEIGMSPLLERGWAMQERVLSRRILHFATNCVLWECQECLATEMNPAGALPTAKFAKKAGEEFIFEYRALDIWPEDDIEDSWYAFIGVYSERYFSFWSDRLPALSGIAAGVQRRILQKYVAGIWEGSFAEGLSWMVVGDFFPDFSSLPGATSTSSRESAKTRTNLPSWSWASARGAVVFRLNSTLWHSNIRVESWALSTDGANTSGQITNARLRIRGKFREISLSELGFSCYDIKGRNCLEPRLIAHQFQYEEAAYLDAIDAEQLTQQVFPCLLIGYADNAAYKAPGWPRERVGGALILVRTDQQRGSFEEFRRIGFLCLPFNEHWSGVPERTIELV